MGFNMNFFNSDTVHEIKTMVQASSRKDEQLKAIHNVLFGNERALLKRTRNAEKVETRLVPFEQQLLKMFEKRLPGSGFTELLTNYRNAPHRYNTEVQSYTGACITLLARLWLASHDANSPVTEDVTRKRPMLCATSWASRNLQLHLVWRQAER